MKDAVAAFWKKAGINTVRYWGQRPWVGDSAQPRRTARAGSTRSACRFAGAASLRRRGGQLQPAQSRPRTARPSPAKSCSTTWIRQDAGPGEEGGTELHPCVFVWSIENEITFINIRNLGLHDPCEAEIRRGRERHPRFRPDPADDDRRRRRSPRQVAPHLRQPLQRDEFSPLPRRSANDAARLHARQAELVGPLADRRRQAAVPGRKLLRDGPSAGGVRGPHRRASVPGSRPGGTGRVQVRPDAGGGIPLARHRRVPLLGQLHHGQGGTLPGVPAGVRVPTKEWDSDLRAGRRR